MRLPLMHTLNTLKNGGSGSPLAVEPTAITDSLNATPKSHGRRPTPRRSQLGVKLGLILLVAIGAGLTVLPGAWRATQRREAYLPQLELMAQRAPYDGRLLALLSARQLEAKQFAAAAATLERTVATGESSEAVWIGLAAAKAANGDPKATAYLELGKRSLRAPELVAASARVQALAPASSGAVRAAAIAPEGAAPLVRAYAQGSFLNGLVEWWGRRHPEDSGFSTRQAWANEQPDNATAQRLWGLALLENNRPRDAMAPLQRAVQLDPNSPAAHFALATLLETQSPANASLEYITCLKLHHDWLPALIGLGRASMAEGLVRTAADIYSAATRVAPASADAWIGLGEADVAATYDRDVALSAFQKAARLAPGRTDYLASYAIALRQNGHWAEAEAMARRSIAAEPRNPHGHYELAGILRDYNPSAARLAEALGQAQAALQLAPDSSEIQLLLAGLLLRGGQPRAAISRLRELIAKAPDNVNALLTLARAERLIGLTQQAQQIAARAVTVYRNKDEMDMLNGKLQTNPADIRAHLELAKLCARLGRTAQAQQERQVAMLLQRDPAQRHHRTRTMPALIEEVLHP